MNLKIHFNPKFLASLSLPPPNLLAYEMGMRIPTQNHEQAQDTLFTIDSQYMSVPLCPFTTLHPAC